MYIPFEQLPQHSRIWVYQADRSFSSDEEMMISGVLKEFCAAWLAHGQPLQTSFKIEYSQFIILSVDESSTGASGCSIDGSVRILKELGNQLKIDFFDRTKIAFLIGRQIQLHPVNQLASLFQTNKIIASTPTFNNLVATKGEWEKNWMISAEKSWLVKYLPKDALSV